MSILENHTSYSMSEVGGTVERPKPSPYPCELQELAEIINGEVTIADKALIADVLSTKWSKNHWDITDESRLAQGAHGLSIGIPVFNQFGNFAALTFHPDLESMRTVNVAKGREKDQVASVTTARDHIEEIFDWDKLPEGLNKARVLGMIDTFYSSDGSPYAGPFGFRGPAADHIPDHLTSTIIDPVTKESMKTVQLIAPGYADVRSNELLERGLAAANSRRHGESLHYFGITSANISSTTTGKDEPAHYKIVSKDGLKTHFGNRAPGFVILGLPDETSEKDTRDRYPHHEPNSTTILDFSRSSVIGETTAVYLARHGSLPTELTRQVLTGLNLGLVVDSGARPSMPVREYPVKFPGFRSVFQGTPK